jgi:tRNA modification GTPase
VSAGDLQAGEAIVLTPAGAAAIAVVRLRGRGVDSFLAKYFSRKLRPGFCVHGELSDGENILDDPLVMRAENGDWADVSLHGGTWAVRGFLEFARREGFAICDSSPANDENAWEEAGSILDREVLANLPLARTREGIEMLLSQPRIWRAAIARKDLDFARILADRSLWWMLYPPVIAIVGEPNVGKSTLANRLFGQERSITADVPGTTRDWVGDMANIDGLPVMLMDTPGIRQTEDLIERAAIERAGEKIAKCDLVVQVWDATASPKGGTPGGLLVINKIDRPAGWDFSRVDALRVSAKNGDGLSGLRGRIRQYFGVGEVGEEEKRPRWWTPRQRKILKRAAADWKAVLEIDQLA